MPGPDSISNSMLASQVQSLLQLWLTRETQYQTWVNGTPGGGDHSDGTYPLTDPSGVTHYVKSPAQLQADVDVITGSGSTSATAAAVSATAAAGSSTSAYGYATAAASSATAAATSATQANTYQATAGSYFANAAASAIAAAASAAAAATSATSAGTSATSATASATSATGSAATATTAATSASSSATAAAASAAAAAAAVSGAIRFKGTWDASVGSFPSSPITGDLWQVSVLGTISGVTYRVGDQIFYTSTAWDKIDNSEFVLSVNTRTGAVVLTSTDVGLNNVSNSLQLIASDNLSDLPSVATALTNLGVTSTSALTTLLAAKAPLASPVFTGTPTVPGYLTAATAASTYAPFTQFGVGGTNLTSTSRSTTGAAQFGTETVVLTNPGAAVSIRANIAGTMTNASSGNRGTIQVLVSTDGGSTFTSGRAQEVSPSGTTGAGDTMSTSASLVLSNVTPTGNIVVKGQCTNLNAFGGNLNFTQGYLDVIMVPA